MKADNTLPYKARMQTCDVVERGDGWLIRNIVIDNVPLTEKVSFESETRMVFERIEGPERGAIQHIIGTDEKGNLTLTFNFELAKIGIPEGGPEEYAYFAPLKDAYREAVTDTLEAVRWAVKEKGRESIPPKNATDVAGDNRWLYEYYRAVDALQLEPFLVLHTDDIQITWCNYPTIQGIDSLRAMTGDVWGGIKAISHTLCGAWSLYDDQVGIVELQVMYTRKNDSICLANACSVLRRRGDKICRLKVHADLTHL
jgi:hypothetical protein